MGEPPKKKVKEEPKAAEAAPVQDVKSEPASEPKSDVKKTEVILHNRFYFWTQMTDRYQTDVKNAFLAAGDYKHWSYPEPLVESPEHDHFFHQDFYSILDHHGGASGRVFAYLTKGTPKPTSSGNVFIMKTSKVRGYAPYLVCCLKCRKIALWNGSKHADEIQQVPICCADCVLEEQRSNYTFVHRSELLNQGS